MKDLIHELIPHAPHLGLYVAPQIPEKLVHNAVRDYATTLDPGEVVALFDATLSGNGKDGSVFAIDRFVFQNNDLEPAHEVRYEDLVRVERRRGFFRGAKIFLEVNRARATFELKLDASARPKALEFLYRFLQEAMVRPVVPRTEAATPEPEPGATDRQAVENALNTLRVQGRLTEADYRRLLAALTGDAA